MLMTIAAIVTALGVSTPADIPDRPCKFEDSTNCIWDAKHMGNGKGTSFITVGKEGPNMKIAYVSHRRAHRLLHGANYAL